MFAYILQLKTDIVGLSQFNNIWIFSSSNFSNSYTVGQWFNLSKALCFFASHIWQDLINKKSPKVEDSSLQQWFHPDSTEAHRCPEILIYEVVLEGTGLTKTLPAFFQFRPSRTQTSIQS